MVWWLQRIVAGLFAFVFATAIAAVFIVLGVVPAELLAVILQNPPAWSLARGRASDLSCWASQSSLRFGFGRLSPRRWPRSRDSSTKTPHYIQRIRQYPLY